MIVATTRAALLRGTTTNELGDQVDVTTPVEGFEDFPISIIETDETQFDQASGTWRSITTLSGRVPSRIPVDEGDRIKDHRDGAIYAVDDYRRTPRGLSGRSSVTMSLRRTSP